VSAAPDVYVGPAFIGWRSWRILPFQRLGVPESVRLCASGTRGIPKVWEPGQMTRALCGKFKTTHEAPSPGCECGVHAYRTREAAQAHLESFSENNNGDEVLGWAFGRVSLWGRIVECEHGWRAEYAYPYELTIHSSDPALAAQVRRLYGVDAVAESPLVPSTVEVEDAAESEDAAGLRLLIGQLKDVKAEVNHADIAIRRAIFDGRLDGNYSWRTGLGTLDLQIGNVLHDLRQLRALTEADEELVLDVQELVANLRDLPSKLQEIERKISGPTQPVKPARPAIKYVPRLALDNNDAIVAAVAEARTQYAKWLGGNGKPWPARADGVAKVLAGLPAPPKPLPAKQVTHSDVIRVGQRLGKLAREGRITLVSRSGSKGYEPIGGADEA
jgi:hypothetical protein